MKIERYLILDTRKVFLTIESLKVITGGLNTIQLLCGILMDEDEAYAEFTNLHYSGLLLRDDSVWHTYDPDVIDMLELEENVSILGLKLLEYLQSIRAYQNGKLPFVFYRMLGRDIILKERIDAV